MTDQKGNIEELIAAHFAGETSSEEERELSLWLNDNDNRRYYDSLKIIFNSSKRPEKYFDTDKAWMKVQSQLHKPQGKVIAFRSNMLLRIAAILILVSVFAGLVFLLNSKEEKLTAYAGNSVKEITLPDSSIVVLNKNSRLTYTDGKSRKVILEGEAYFKIKHDEKNVFTVETNGISISDIGTEFNVKNYRSDSVIVLVEEGEVSVASNDSIVNLKAGEKIVYSKSGGAFHQPENDPNALSYKTKVFVFENAPLSVVVQKLNEVYGTQIIADQNIAECHITSTFKNEKVETILDIISVTLKLRIVQSNGEIKLEGEGCGL